MPEGSCLCGAVRFTVTEPLTNIAACHCGQCRKQSGHYWAAAEMARESLSMINDATLRWYQSSEKARRGFCATCGSFLFWEPIDSDRIDVAMGAIEGPTATRLDRHIFVAEKGDYYDIADGLPQNAQ
ncbi:MAG: GFA family protein [Sphingomonas sp.]|uniref:GFA family protein n=1 Tax=Sphingomonas sp. TaxID=28214 RepID=UPI0035A8C5D1|nr:GFA family protein [Sphingomonas sp.]